MITFATKSTKEGRRWGNFNKRSWHPINRKLAATRRNATRSARVISDTFSTNITAPDAGQLMQQKAIQRAENKTGIPDEVKARMETAFNTDFSGVRVHPNSPAAPSVGAVAYTRGTDIHFAPGQFRPNTSAGQRLLGHEMAHVQQQSQGRVQPTTEVNGLPVNDNPALEQEADRLGSKAAG